MKTKIAEILVRRQFERDGVTLPEKFWNLSKYKPHYQRQLREATKLIRIYNAEIVLAVVEKEKWCFSLAAKNIVDLIEKEQDKRERNQAMENLNKQQPTEIKTTKPITFRKKEKTNFKDG